MDGLAAFVEVVVQGVADGEGFVEGRAAVVGPAAGVERSEDHARVGAGAGVALGPAAPAATGEGGDDERQEGRAAKPQPPRPLFDCSEWSNLPDLGPTWSP